MEDDAENSGLVPASYLGPVPVGYKSGGGEGQGTGKRGRFLDTHR